MWKTRWKKKLFQKKYLIELILNLSFFIFDCLGIKDKETIEIYESFSNLLDKNIEDSFYILNKIDKATNKKEVEIENFNNYIHDRYKVALNKNHFLGTNALLLSKETEKYNNFDSYQNKSFIVYLKQKMEKDLKIKDIKLKDYPTRVLMEVKNNINDLIKKTWFG